MIVFILCFILFLVGLYGLITRRNLIKIVISLSIMEFSIFIFLILIGYIDGGIAPIITDQVVNPTYVDPLPQALVLTAIVIGVGTTALGLALAKIIYQKYGTFEIDEMGEE